MVDWNQDADVGLTWKGFFQIYDGATPYRFKELVDVTVRTAADTEKTYSDDGKKRKRSIGDSSTYQFRIKKSADLWSTAFPSTDAKTIGYFQNQIINNRVIPKAQFEGVQETEAASNKFVRVKFTATVEDIEDSRSPTTGAPEVVISGEILTLDQSQRTST
ncbi:MAG: hypothetical protein QXW37_08455 [Candidatus Nitrosotenuis sp.]